MSEHLTKSVAQNQPPQKIAGRIFAKRVAGFAMLATAVAIIAVSVAKAGNKQDKYTLVSPSGIAFSDFRGYEDWSVVSTAKTDVLKAIVANPAMINAYKAGVPSGGQLFPEGSKIAKIQWTTKKSTDAQFVVDVPNVLSQVFLMEKDSKRFPKSNGGWGYAVYNYDPATNTFSPDAKSLSDCGNACHTAVKANDYIFHPYQKR
jgi:hypothetical protein